MTKINIGIIGQGFVGNAVYQKFKKYFKVLTFDIDETKCNSSFENLVNNSNYIFVCLPSPMNPDGSCDISIVDNTLKKLNNIYKNITVIIKSTVYPGATEIFNKKYKNLSVVFNPEFLTERNAEKDYEMQERIIIGGPRPSTTKLKQIFSIVFPNAHIIKTGSKHAEFIKYFTNCFLATKVSFSNEMYEMSNRLGLDYDKVIEYATLDNRLGKTHFNVPGPDGDVGFGGHCFPKDLNALLHVSNNLSTVNNVLRATLKTNDEVRTNRDWENMKGRGGKLIYYEKY